MKVNFKNILSFWIGLAIIFLAYSILKFSNSLISLNKNIPEILNQVSLINEKIDTITQKSVPNILQVIPPITNQIDSIQSKIPLILSETNNIRRTTIPNILSEVDSILIQIPFVLTRIDSINKQIPNIVTTINSATETINQSLIRIDSINKQIPEITLTINSTNDSISSYMEQADKLIANADKVANRAGRNASKGFLGGIISTPFDIAKGMGSFVLGKNSKLTKEDIVVTQEQVLLFLNKNTNVKKEKWSSKQIKKSGSIKVIRSYQENGKKIKEIKISFDIYKESITAFFFQENDGQWYFWK